MPKIPMTPPVRSVDSLTMTKKISPNPNVAKAKKYPFSLRIGLPIPYAIKAAERAEAQKARNVGKA
jgi:hypothetical protein